MSMENKLYNDNTKTTRSDAHVKMLRKALGALDSAVVLPPLRVESKLRSLKVRAQVM